MLSAVRRCYASGTLVTGAAIRCLLGAQARVPRAAVQGDDPPTFRIPAGTKQTKPVTCSSGDRLWRYEPPRHLAVLRGRHGHRAFFIRPDSRPAVWAAAWEMLRYKAGWSRGSGVAPILPETLVGPRVAQQARRLVRALSGCS